MCRQYYTFESFRTSNAVDAYTCSKVAIRYSRAGEPVVALVLPKAARIDIRHLDRLQVLRALEAELGRNTEYAIVPVHPIPVSTERLRSRLQELFAGAVRLACRGSWGSQQNT